MKLTADEPLYEIVDGRRVELASMGVDGGKVLPGFQLSLGDLFEDESPQENK